MSDNTYALFVLTEPRIVKSRRFGTERTVRRFRLFCAPAGRTYESGPEIAEAGMCVQNGPWTLRGADAERAVGRKAAARLLETLSLNP